LTDLAITTQLRKQASTLGVAANLLHTFVREYPGRAVLITGGQFVVGLLDNISVLALLPLLQVVLGESGMKQPQLGQTVADAFSWAGVPLTLVPVLTILVVLVLVKSALSTVSSVFNNFSYLTFGTERRKALIGHVIKAHWPYLLTQPAGRYANILGGEVVNYMAAIKASFALISRSVQAMLYLGTALLVSWQFTLLAGLYGAFMLVALRPTLSIVRKTSHRRTEFLNRMSGRMVDVLQGIKAMKSMGREKAIADLLDADVESVNRSQRVVAVSVTIRDNAIEVFVVVGLALGLYSAMEYFSVGAASIMVLVLLFVRLMNELGFLHGSFHQILSYDGSVAAVEKAIKDAREQCERPHHGLRPSLEAGITLRGVSIGYDGTPVVEAVNIEIPARSLTVIFGPSGSGKTTILDTIIGFLNPSAGDVIIDGRPIAQIDLTEWRRMIGYVPQDLFLFHDTIRENITLSEPNISDASVWEALTAAGAAEFVAELPHGIDTVVGERGMRLSGGQRQRLSIARALVRRPALLLLDEATSALDVATERAICKTVKDLSAHMTVIAVSHQPAIVELADRVYEVSGGKVAQRSMPSALSARVAIMGTP
jgi:ATP-binding cassette subfamily C protein